jgi:nitrate reductase gamma subunit
MSALDVLLWGVAPYVMVAKFVGGTVWRYRYDKFGWTTRSEDVPSPVELRWRPDHHQAALTVSS